MTRRWRDESGQVAGIEALPFGVLVFVVGILLVANAWGVIDAKSAATAAAREATRAYVEASDEATAAADAVEAARRSIEGHGRSAARAEVWSDDARLVRCAPATWHVSYPVPSLRLPFVGGFGGTITVHAAHTEIVDPYRSGSLGRGRCHA